MAIKKLSTLSGLVDYRSTSGLYDGDLINISLNETPSLSSTSDYFSDEGWVSSKVTYGELKEDIFDSTFLSGGFLDDDTLSANSPSGIASQQSIKAYAEGMLSGGDAGYQIFPSGLIIEWGRESVDGVTTDTVSLTPSLFSNIWVIFATYNTVASGINSPCGTQKDSTSQFKITNGSTATKYIFWIVIGN